MNFLTNTITDIVKEEGIVSLINDYKLQMEKRDILMKDIRNEKQKRDIKYRIGKLGSTQIFCVYNLKIGIVTLLLKERYKNPVVYPDGVFDPDIHHNWYEGNDPETYNPDKVFYTPVRQQQHSPEFLTKAYEGKYWYFGH